MLFVRTAGSTWPIIVLLQETPEDVKGIIRERLGGWAGFAIGKTIWNQLAYIYILIANPILRPRKTPAEIENYWSNVEKATLGNVENFKRYVNSVVPSRDKSLPPFLNVPLAVEPTTKIRQDFEIVTLYLEVLAKQYEKDFAPKTVDACFERLSLDITPKASFEILPPAFFERASACPKRFIVTQLLLPTHANALVIDKKLGIVFRFEPHSASSEFEYLDRWITAVLVPALSAATKREYRYENPTTLCPNIPGLQLIEATANFSREGGFCVAWSALLLALVILNPGWSLVELQQRMLNAGEERPIDPITRPEELRSYIRRFVAAMDCYVPELPPAASLAVPSRERIIRNALGLSFPLCRDIAPHEVGYITEIWVTFIKRSAKRAVPLLVGDVKVPNIYDHPVVFAAKNDCGRIFITGQDTVRISENLIDRLPLPSVHFVTKVNDTIRGFYKEHKNNVTMVENEGILADNYYSGVIDFVQRPLLATSGYLARYAASLRRCPRLVVER